MSIVMVPRYGTLLVLHERTKPPYNQPSAVPAKYNWPTLLKSASSQGYLES